MKFWNLLAGQEVSTLKDHTSPVSYASFSRDGTTLVTHSDDAPVRVWRADGIAKIRSSPMSRRTRTPSPLGASSKDGLGSWARCLLGASDHPNRLDWSG